MIFNSALRFSFEAKDMCNWDCLTHVWVDCQNYKVQINIIIKENNSRGERGWKADLWPGGSSTFWLCS